MTIKEYVDDVLQVPVTRIGNRYITEAIELVLDSREHKFYNKLAGILRVNTHYLEKAMRDAKTTGLLQMSPELKLEIFGKADVPTSEYIIRATEYYRRRYEDKT